MSGLILNRPVYRKVISGLVTLLGVGALLVVPASTASAAGTHHWIAGTYQAFVPGVAGPGPQAMVLHTDGTATFIGQSGTWGRVPAHRDIIFIGVSTGNGGRICVEVGQPPSCVITVVLTGPKTTEGIANQAAPGSANTYIGSVFFSSTLFWAVRTGSAPRT